MLECVLRPAKLDVAACEREVEESRFHRIASNGLVERNRALEIALELETQAAIMRRGPRDLGTMFDDTRARHHDDIAKRGKHARSALGHTLHARVRSSR